MKVTCFCCNQGFCKWRIFLNDEKPWDEHARYSPSCTFVLLSKGKEFVDKISIVDKIHEEKENELLRINPEVKFSL